MNIHAIYFKLSPYLKNCRSYCAPLYPKPGVFDPPQKYYSVAASAFHNSQVNFKFSVQTNKAQRVQTFNSLMIQSVLNHQRKREKKQTTK